MFVGNVKKLFASASLFSILITLSSCGVWTDFTTYFNTYYNAKTLFDQVEEEIQKQKKDIFIFREDLQTNSQLVGQTGTQLGQQPSNLQFAEQQTNTQFSNQPGFGQSAGTRTGTQLPGSLNENLKKVIEKCSKILQYEKNSSYFADALFITGKALYYQQEYARAQRKFTELAGLGETKYSSENKLWLAKTDLQLRSFDEGLRLIDEVKTEAINDGDDKLFNDASITKISFLIFREDLRGAIEECKNYLKESKDDETSALVSFQMGKIYLSLNDSQNSFDAFSDVLKYSPTVDIEFKSRFESAKLLKTLNRIDESETAFDDLRYLGKFKNFVDQVLIELGQIYAEKNKTNLAIDIFREVDSTYRQLPTSGIAQMKLAEIYHKKLGMYDSSYKYYNKVSISMSAREIKLEAGKRATDFNRYFALKEEEKGLKLSLDYLNDQDKYLRDSIDYAIAYRQYLSDIKAMGDAQKTDPNVIGQTDLNPAFQEQQFKQQQIALLQKPKKDLVLTSSQLIALGKYKKPERPLIPGDSIRTILSKNLYNLASLFYSELDVPDSAYFYFNNILKDFSDKPIRVQTMYALGTYYETHDDSVKADSIFQYIYNNFEKDPLRNAAAQKLGLVKKEESKVVSTKEEDPAEKFYVEAEKLYYDKKYEAAIDSFKNIYKRFPQSSFAPKSVYYSGLIYEKDLKMYDSAASAYQTLTKDFSKSPLVGTVMAKYTEYKNEKDRIKKEEEIKLKELEAKQKELLEKQKEKDLKSVEVKKIESNEQQPQPQKVNDETIDDEILVKRAAVKDSTFKKDSLKIKLPNKILNDSAKIKTDTAKVKPSRIID